MLFWGFYTNCQSLYHELVFINPVIYAYTQLLSGLSNARPNYIHLTYTDILEDNVYSISNILDNYEHLIYT